MVTMRKYLESRLVQVGIALFAVGCWPLLFVMSMAAIGLWPDKNPNPVGPGMLAAFTFWPSVICVVIGVVRVRLRRH